ncbi:MAG: hypothetical protein LBG42_03855, partial [Treponema sp.]|nr:hypothetical protein [Treponema sp.]
LFPGNSVRLRYGYIVTCTGFDRDEKGNICAVRCTYDPATKGGNAPDNRKVKGTIHWVSAAHAVPIEVRVYDYLFSAEKPMETPSRSGGSPGDFTCNLNPHSLEVIPLAWGEPSLAYAAAGDRYQFERLGYFVRDTPPEDGAKGNGADTGGAAKDGSTRLVFNKTIGLRDTWAKIRKNE